MRFELLGLTACGVIFACVADPIPLAEADKLLKSKLDVVGFYHVYAEGPDFEGIVTGQVDTIKKNGLLEHMDKIFYSTMGTQGEKFKIEGEKYIHLAHYGDQGEEIQTLGKLHQFCASNPGSKVLYFHDKGSFHHNYFNAKFCSLLNCYVLNPHCIDALKEHDTCGWRISPTPIIHYSGNMWWARCNYINKLVDPMAQLNNETFIEVNKDLHCVNSEGRYFAEAWVGSAPTILPADCMNSTIDSTYLWGYKFPEAADQFCGSFPSGLPCQTASTLTHFADFKHALNHMNGLIQTQACRDPRDELIKRSELWYGEPPHTYLEWMDQLSVKAEAPEGLLVRFTDGSQVYIVKDGVLRGIPNLKTFIAMGLDFDNVKAYYVSDKKSFKMGTMLSSV